MDFSPFVTDSVRDNFDKMYGGNIADAINRYSDIYTKFTDYYGDGDFRIFSAPGRTEIGGNHTDHNHGRVLAASVSVDTVAFVRSNGTMRIKLRSEGYKREFHIDLSNLNVNPKENGTTNALIRGCAARMVELGYSVGGFDAYISSNVLRGSGLSSSAAFEVMICAVFDGLFNNSDMDAVERAKISQFSENVYFGKPSGLMDQSASSVGGLITIDFADTDNPIVEKVHFDFATTNHKLVIVDTGGSHANLTGEYANIFHEMSSVSEYFGKQYLREVDYSDFLSNISKLSKKVSARAILRAMHFFMDNERVGNQVAALNNNDFDSFKNMIIASGESSWKLLQNCYVVGEEQGLTLALALSENMLKGKGAWRVHGGGFAGTIQAFVPNDMVKDYIALMDSIFYSGAAASMAIRNIGATEIAL